MLLTFSVLAAREAISSFSQPQPSPNNISSCFADNTLIMALRVTVGVTCSLSMIGSVLIILSYVLISNIRTKAREILVNLSLMDFMCAAANFTGVCINFYQYLGNSDVRRAHGSMNRVCLAQAFFAMYGTISSELWTMCIAVYIFILIMFQEKKTVNRSMPAFYVVSYGLPLLCTAWFIATKKLGYDRLSGSGWCSVILYQHGQYKPLTAVFANDLWIYLTVLLVSVIFFSLHCYLKHEVSRSRNVFTPNLHRVEVKLLFIPLFFILLRIWSLLFVILTVEAQLHLNCKVVQFFTIINGIGDSGQGFANAILYVLFTPRVRRYFLYRLLCRKWPPSSSSASPLHSDPQVFFSYSEDGDKGENSGDYSITEKDAKSLLLNT